MTKNSLNNEQKLKNNYSKHTIKQLREIAYSPEKYEKWALNAAKDELLIRYYSLFSINDKDFITFSSIFQNVTFEDISEELFMIKKKSRISECKQAFEKLIISETESNSSFFTYELNIAELKKRKLDIEIVNIITEEKTYAYMLTWTEWLNIRVKKEQILQYGEDAIITNSLLKITENGFFENYDIQTFSVTDESVIDEEEEIPQNNLKRQRPWVRYFARITDYALIRLILTFVLKAAFPNLLELFPLIKYISITSISIVAWIFIESILLCTIGTTPGKWILEIKIQNTDGSKLSLKQSIMRSIMVFSLGYAFGISYLNICSSIWSYLQLSQNKITFWDKKLNLHVIHSKINVSSIIIVIFIQIISLILLFI